MIEEVDEESLNMRTVVILDSNEQELLDTGY